MVYSRTAELEVIVEHYHSKENAEMLKKHKRDYINLMAIEYMLGHEISIEEFDDMIESGKLMNIEYQSDFSMQQQPFESSITEVVFID
jgi:hypothetical protein